jgi:hypothetical protein
MSVGESNLQIQYVRVTGESTPANGGSPPFMTYHVQKVYNKDWYWTVATVNDLPSHTPEDTAKQLGELLAKKYGVECRYEPDFWAQKGKGQDEQMSLL